MIITVTVNAALDRTASIDNFQAGKINRSKIIAELPGGKGLNSTRALKTLGEDVLATGFIGGKFGEQFELLMEKENIKSDFFKIKGNTRICTAIIDQKNNVITEINENGAEISDLEVSDFYKKLSNLGDKGTVIISGSVPSSLPQNIYYKIIELFNNRGFKTVLDARSTVLKEGIRAKPYIIKPNKAEAEELLGYSLDTNDSLNKAINDLLEYCSIACITLEDNGCIISNKDVSWHFVPPKIDVVNTVGCGDSLLAGLVCYLERGYDLKEAGKWGIACGSANALTDRAGFIHLSDVKNIYKSVEVKEF